MTTYDVVVVGAGLFGSVIAEALRGLRQAVLVIDDQRPGAGSGPAACLMKPSWFSGLGSSVSTPALELLDKLYGLRQISFNVLAGKAQVYWCDPRTILKGANVIASVKRLHRAAVGWEVVTAANIYQTTTVVVAAGIWSPLLATIEGKLVGQAGMACLWPDAKIDPPFIRVWAPYRQLTVFNRGDGLWAGDSSAVRMDKWSDGRAVQVEERCSSAVSEIVTGAPKRLFGVRPYSTMSPCYLKQPRPGLWVATGGAKNGTIAAAWCASQLMKALS